MTYEIFWFQIGLILLCTLLLGFFVRRVLKRLEQYSSTPEWVKSFYETSYTPIAWLIWGFGILIALKVAANNTETNLPTDLIFKISSILIVLTVTWILFKWKISYEKVLKIRLLENQQRTDTDTILFALGKIFSVILVVIAAMIVLEIIGIPLTAILAFGGLGGIAIGLAGKDVFVNLFGGLMLHINRPFIVGDLIYSPNKDFSGTVEQIGWYNTQIRTLERRPIYIPNSIISDAIIENTGRMYNRQIKEHIGIRYDDADKVNKITDQIELMLKSEKEIDQEQAIYVSLVSLGEYALNIEVNCFTKTIIQKEWRKIRQKVFLNIIDIIAKNGAQMPYPITSIKLYKAEHE